MERESVESSNIKSVGYDPASQTLEVEFHSGSVYRYESVSETLYREFLEAESKGKFFNRNIKGVYEYERV